MNLQSFKKMYWNPFSSTHVPHIQCIASGVKAEKHYLYGMSRSLEKIAVKI